MPYKNWPPRPKKPCERCGKLTGSPFAICNECADAMPDSDAELSITPVPTLTQEEHIMTTHTDHDCCANCGRLLNSYEEAWLCGPCTERQRDHWMDPTDEELLRRDAITARFWLGDWAAVGLAVWVGILLTTLVVGRELH